MPAHGHVKVSDIPVSMLSTHSKEADVKSLENRATTSSDDAHGVGARYAIVQGSKWFRDKNAATKTDVSKHSDSVHAETIRPETVVTSVRKDAVATSEHGKEHSVEWVDSGQSDPVLPDHVTVAVSTNEEDELQRSGSTNLTSPAHTSTRVKTLTPFSLRNRRDEMPKSASPNPLSAGRLSEAHHSSAPDIAPPYLGMTDAQIVSAIVKKIGADADSKQSPSANQERSTTPSTLTITTQNSTDLNNQLSELAKDVSPTVGASDGPPQASSMPTLTVQTTSTRATPAVQQTMTTHNTTSEPSDCVSSSLSANQPVTLPGNDSRYRSTDTLPERVSPRPRATIFADIRERVFGSRPPSTSLLPQQQQPEQQQQHQQLQPAQSLSKLNEGAKAERTLPPKPKSAPLAVAEDDFLDTDQVISISPELRTENQPTERDRVLPGLPQLTAGRTEADGTYAQSDTAPASSQLSTVSGTRNYAQLPASGERQFGSAVSAATTTQTAASMISSAIGQALSRDQIVTSRTTTKTDEQAVAQTGQLSQQLQQQQRVVTKAEVSPFRMMDWPGTHYGVPQMQKLTDASAEGSAEGRMTPVKQKTPATQDRIDMSVPSLTVRTDGIAGTTTSGQEPMTVRLQKTPAMTPHSAMTSSASVEDASLIWRTPATQGSTVTGSRTVPSSVSRVDWAKQRFGATQSLDSSGLSTGPETQPTRTTGESSPKLAPRHLAVMPSVTETTLSRTPLDDVRSSPGTCRRLQTVSGQHFVPSTSQTSGGGGTQITTKAVLSTSSLTRAPAASLLSSTGNGSSKVAIVHGLQVTSGTTERQQQLALTSRPVAPASGFQASTAMNFTAASVPNYSQNSVPSSAIIMKSTSGQVPAINQITPISSPSSILISTSTQATPVTRPSQPPQSIQSATRMTTTATTGGSCFAMRLPDPVHLRTSSLTQASSGSSQKPVAVSDVDKRRPDEIQFMSAVSKQPPALAATAPTSTTISSFPTIYSNSTQSPVQAIRLQGNGVSPVDGQRNQPIHQSLTSPIAASLPSGSSSLQRELVSSPPKTTQQFFQFPVSPETGKSAESSSNPPRPLTSSQRQTFALHPASVATSIRSDGIAETASSHSVSFTGAASPPTLTQVEIQTPCVDQIVARPALPTVRAFISKPDIPEVHLTAVALRSAVVVESAIPESKLVPAATSIQPQLVTQSPTGIQQVTSLQHAAPVEKQVERGIQKAPTGMEMSSTLIETVAQVSNVVSRQTAPTESVRGTGTSNVSLSARAEVLQPCGVGIEGQSAIQSRIPIQQKTPPGVVAVASAVTLPSAAAVVTPSLRQSTVTPMTSSAAVSISGNEARELHAVSTTPKPSAAAATEVWGQPASATARPTSAQFYVGSQPPAARSEPSVQPTTGTLSSASATVPRQTTSNTPTVTVAAVLPTSHTTSRDATQLPQQQQQQQQRQSQHHTSRSLDSTSSPRTESITSTAVREVAANTDSRSVARQEHSQSLQQQQLQGPVSILKKSHTEPLVTDTTNNAASRKHVTSSQQQQKSGRGELNDALAELDSIAAQTRQLSKSLSFPSPSTRHLQASPTLPSSRSIGGARSPDPTLTDVSPRSSIISTMAANIDAKLHGKTASVHPKLAALHEARSLDRSGVTRRQLEQLSAASTTSSSGPIHKSVTLRKPRPLRKAQTVSLTGLGLGVDPDLMSLLASRKEKSASDDEEQKSTSPSRSEEKEGEDESEKMPSVAERIKRMETKKIRFSVLREKAAQRRMAQSTESLGTRSSAPGTGRLQEPLWSMTSSDVSPDASSQAKLDRLACFAAISDTSIGMKRRQLQRRHLVTSRRLSQPVTLDELNKAEMLQSVVAFNDQIRDRISSHSPYYARRWGWQRQPNPRDRVAAITRRSRRRRSLPPSSASGDISDRMSARQRAIMLRSSRYNAALPARVHSAPRVVIASPVDESPPTGGVIMGHGPLLHAGRSAPSASPSVWNSPPSVDHMTSPARSSLTADQRSSLYSQLSVETQQTAPSPTSMSSKQLVTSQLPQQYQHQQQQQQQPQQQYFPSDRSTDQRHPGAVQSAGTTPMAAAARLVQTASSTAATPTATQTAAANRPPIDRSRTDDHVPTTASHQRKQHPVQPTRRPMQRMDSLDDDEFDKMVEVNIRQLQVDSGTGKMATAASSVMPIPAASTSSTLSPRLARRAQQQQQYGYTGGNSSFTAASIRSQGQEVETANSATSRSAVVSASRQAPSVADSPRQHQVQQQQQQQQQEKKDEESEDELSKLSIAEKLKLFSAKNSVTSQPRIAENVGGSSSTKARRQANRYQTQLSDDEPVTWDELEQAAHFDTSGYGRHQHHHQQQQHSRISGPGPTVSPAGYGRTQTSRQYTDDVTSHTFYYRDY